MELDYVQRPEYLNSKVKAKMISEFVRKEFYGLELALEEYEEIEGNQRDALNSSVIIKGKGFKSVEQTRPSSACSTKSGMVESRFLDSNISEAYLSAINKVTINRIKSFIKAKENDNISTLLYSSIIMLVVFYKDLGSGVIAKNTAYGTFITLLSDSCGFIKNIRSLPKMIRLKKLSVVEIQKALSWFNLVSIQELGVYTVIFDIIKETLMYARKFYCIPIVLSDHHDIKSNIMYKTVLQKTNRLNMTQKASSVKREVPNKQIEFENLDKPIGKLNANNRTLKPNKIFDAANGKPEMMELCNTQDKAKEKNNKFLLSSRLFKKVKDYFDAFVKLKEKNYELRTLLINPERFHHDFSKTLAFDLSEEISMYIRTLIVKLVKH